MIHDSIIVNLPFPAKFLGISFFKFKRMGFTFTNMAIFLFRENNQLETSDEYNEWIKKNGETKLVSEMIYSAAQTYLMNNQLKQKFTKQNLNIAIASTTEENQQKIVNCWKNSSTFGTKEEKKK